MKSASWFGNVLVSCWQPLTEYVRMNRNESIGPLGQESDPLTWYKDLNKHFCGEFSFAAVQANRIMEDHSQVESGKNSTFVGVYDGHAGHEVSRYIGDNLFTHLKNLVGENGTMSEEILSNAISAIEDGFLSIVKQIYPVNKTIASCGSCCLVGVIWEGTLYVANLGDSRAVLGRVDQKRTSCLSRSESGSERNQRIIAIPLTRDHNARKKKVRQELRAAHPDDPKIVYKRFNVWRIKGIIQVSRAIGDAYLKSPEFPLDKTYSRFHNLEPLRRPVLRADPSTFTRVLQPSDKFLIFASDGLWEQLSNQAVVEIVYNNPREGIARRLIRLALHKAAARVNKSYGELKGYDPGKRRYVHDDISVVVIFVDHEMLENNIPVPEQSFRAFLDSVQGQDSTRDAVTPESV